MKTNTITWIGCTGYNVTKDQLRRIKTACKIAKLQWQPIASRPTEVESFIKRVETMSGQIIN